MTTAQEAKLLVERLLPCPFCGSKAEANECRGAFKAVCTNEDCGVEVGCWLTGKNASAAAIAAWNSRAPERLTAPVENGELVERVRIMAKQRLSTEMDDLDQADADWQGAYDWFCKKSRANLAAFAAHQPVSSCEGVREIRKAAAPILDHLNFMTDAWPGAVGQVTDEDAIAIKVGWLRALRAALSEGPDHE